MLKKREPVHESSPAPTPTSPAKGIRPAPSEKTTIGQQITIQGDIRGMEDLVIEGEVKGSVVLEGRHLTVGPRGKVEGQISADNVTVSGRLVGNIHAQGKVEITKEADFNGEIKAKRISVEDGAYLKAVIELERQSGKKPTPLAKTEIGRSAGGQQGK